MALKKRKVVKVETVGDVFGRESGEFVEEKSMNIFSPLDNSTN